MTDRIVYWGYRHYGRHDARDHFRYNRKSVSQMGLGCSIAKKWEYDGETQIYNSYYKANDEIKSQTITFDATSEELLEIYQNLGIRWDKRTDLDYDYLGYNKWLKFTKEERKDWYTNLRNLKKTEKVPKDIQDIYPHSGETWHDHFFQDLINVDLFIPTYYDSIFEYEPFLRYFRTCENVVAYKTDLVDVQISRLNLIQKDLETLKKEDIFYILDHYIVCNRLVEQKLREHQIPYTYFDLDTDDFDKWVPNLLPREDGYGWGASPFDRTTERYAIAKQISEEYIRSRGLTNIRLDGKLTDRVR